MQLLEAKQQDISMKLWPVPKFFFRKGNVSARSFHTEKGYFNTKDMKEEVFDQPLVSLRFSIMFNFKVVIHILVVCCYRRTELLHIKLPLFSAINDDHSFRSSRYEGAKLVINLQCIFRLPGMVGGETI